MTSNHSCVHGRWTSDDGLCHCDHFWQGSDCSLKTCVAGVFNSTTLECQCRAGYGGEFCHTDACLDRGRWHCDEGAPNERQLCPDEFLESWNPLAMDDPAWQCSCGFGQRIGSLNESSCVCHDGFFGQFCQWKSCGEGAVWNLWNHTCVEENYVGNGELRPTTESTSETDVGRGVLGFDLSSELLIASLLMAIFLITFLLVIRLCARRLRCDERTESLEAFERIAVEQFRAQRSRKFNRGGRFEGCEVGLSDGADGKINSNYFSSFHSIVPWQNAGPSGRSLANRRLTTVMEESSDEDSLRL